MSTLGIDVYVLTGTINFSEVYSSGKRFCIVKSSQGKKTGASEFNPFTDKNYSTNIDGAFAAGLECGTYHYMNGINFDQVNQEADLCVADLKLKRSKITLPAFIDFEDPVYADNPELNPEKNTELVLQFARKISKAGFIPGIASFPGYYYGAINYSALNEIRIWVSWYRDSLTESEVLNSFPDTVVWQMYAGTCPGVPGAVDIDTGFFDRPIIPAQLELKNPGNPCYIDYGRKYLVIPQKTTLDVLRDYIKNPSISIVKANESSDYCGTGSIVNILSNGSIVNTYQVVVLGDIDGNGKVNPTDYILVKRYLLGLATFTPIQKYAADYNEDGEITDIDWELIRDSILSGES